MKVKVKEDGSTDSTFNPIHHLIACHKWYKVAFSGIFHTWAFFGDIDLSWLSSPPVGPPRRPCADMKLPVTCPLLVGGTKWKLIQVGVPPGPRMPYHIHLLRAHKPHFRPIMALKPLTSPWPTPPTFVSPPKADAFPARGTRPALAVSRNICVLTPILFFLYLFFKKTLSPTFLLIYKFIIIFEI